MQAAPPLPKSPLISSYNQMIWPKISVAYFTQWFQSIFIVGSWMMYPLKLTLLALSTYPHRVVKEPHFEAWTWPEPELGSSPTLIFEARFRPESQIYRGS